VVLTDTLVNRLLERGSAPVTVSGISLGGWATNLHAACYGSAHRYLSLLAGAALDDLFLESSYGASQVRRPGAGRGCSTRP